MILAELIDEREDADYIWNHLLIAGVDPDNESESEVLWKFLKAYERLIIYLLMQQEEQKKEEPSPGTQAYYFSKNT